MSSHSCILFFFSSRRRHTRWPRDWSSDVCSSDLDGLLWGLASEGTVFALDPTTGAVMDRITTDLSFGNTWGRQTSLFARERDRKSTRLNSSHVASSYAAFCLQHKRLQHRMVQKRGK